MEKVVILLSTYNGAKYLEEQLNSLINQNYTNIHILVRDDGSSDNTCEILEKFKSSYNNVDYYKGNNIGSAESFMELAFNSGTYDYYAFCDQDDVWLEDKIKVAVNAIKDYSEPALYHGLAGCVDSELKPLPNRHYVPKQDFGGALISSATGCTMVFNYALMNAIRGYRPLPGQISMHDAWVYRVAYGIGATVIYDPISHMKYRQHGNNVSGGAKMSFRNKFQRAYSINAGLRSRVACELLNGYRDNMCEQNKYLADLLANYKSDFFKKIKLLFSKDISTNYFKTNVQNDILILLNRL